MKIITHYQPHLKLITLPNRTSNKKPSKKGLFDQKKETSDCKLIKKSVNTNAEFEEVWDLITRSFHVTEYSPKSEYLYKIHYNPKFRVFKYLDSQHKLIGMMSVWNFEDFVYVEHLAVAKEAQGKSYGTKIMKDLMDSTNKQIVLEVEDPNHLPESERINGRRRIKFYNRLGFFMNNAFVFRQPQLKKTVEIPPILFFMSTDGPLEQSRFKYIYNKLVKEMYGWNSPK